MADDRRRLLVTDHAIVRYCERILGIDVKGSVVDALLADGREDMVRALVNGEIRIGKTDAVLRVRNGQVVKVLLNDSRAGHRTDKHSSRKGTKPRCTRAAQGEE
jgi:hypothetical protein